MTIAEYLENIGEKKYRITQIEKALYKEFVQNFDEITTLSKDLREKLKEEFPFSSLTVKIEKKSSNDQTEKVIFETHDKHQVEAVLMRHLTGRITLCVSCQVGCPNKCLFCATGKLGLKRDLKTKEIIDQYLHFARKLKKEDKKINNIVFMGMGEPFLNYDNVLHAVEILNNPNKIGLGFRHITISTCGIIPGLQKFMKEGIQVNLAISLHAPNDELRTKLMPINKAYPLADLMDVLDQYVKKTGRRLFYEYIMLKGMNDSPKEAQELGKLLQGKLAHINLIAYNPIDTSDPLQKTSETDIRRFQRTLDKYGVPSTVRASLGDDIDAACGQLVGKE